MTYFEELSKANFAVFDEQAKAAVQGAYDLAKEKYHNPADVPHLLSSLCNQSNESISLIIKHMGKDFEQIKKTAESDLFNLMFLQLEKFSMSEDLDNVLVNAEQEMKSMNDVCVRTEHILLSILHCDNKSKYLLEGAGITYKEMQKFIKSEKPKLTQYRESQTKKKVDETGLEASNTSILNTYGEDLTQLAREGKLTEVIGRDAEVNLIMEVLCRRNKNNPVVIGDSGVGKTAVKELLIQRIAKGDVPDALKNKKVYSIDVSSLTAASKYKGEFEEKVKTIFKEIELSNGEIILSIDDFSAIVGAGNEMGNMLKSALGKGKIRIIGEATITDYGKFVEKDKSLARLLQTVVIEEPSNTDTITILRGSKQKYEAFHGVKISDAAVVAAVDLSVRYINDRKLPDKAIDLIDLAAARTRIQINALPENLVAIEKKIGELEKEKSGIDLDKENMAGEKSQISFDERSAAIIEEIAKLQTSLTIGKTLWEENKKCLLQIKTYGQQIQELNRQLKIAEQDNNAEFVAKIKTETIPELRKKISELETTLEKSQSEGNVVIKDVIDYNDIASVVSKQTGIPVTKLAQAESSKLAHGEEILGTRVIGQDRAIKIMCNAMRRARAGLRDQKKPIGSFIYLGPTGTGKTELAKAMAEFLFGDEDALIRFDMSEYLEKANASKFIGAGPSYVGYEDGGQLTEAIRKKPYSVLLLDEIEKAHPDIFDLLLQVLDDGRLTDGKGRTVNCKNLLIIMTSNIGSRVIMEKLSEKEEKDEKDEKTKITPLIKEEPLSVEKDILPLLQKFFRPEFINRLDDTIVFNPISKESLRKIVDIQLRSFTNLAKKEKKLTLHFDDEVKKFLAQKGWNPAFGARPLKRAIQDYLVDTLSLQIIEGKIVEGDKIKVLCKDDGLVFEKIEDVAVEPK